MAEDLRHRDRERGRTAGARDDAGLADVARGLRQQIGGDREAHRGDGGGGAGGIGAQHGGRAVHREIDAGIEDRRPDERHDRHEAFHQHRAVADERRIGLAGDQLGRRAAGDQRVKAGDGATGDGDEQEREQRSRPHRAAAAREHGDRGHAQRRRHDRDADGQRRDRADLEKGGQIVTRGEQQPDRQDRGDRAVADQDPAQLHRRVGEQRGERGRGGDIGPEHDRGEQPDHAEQRHLAHPARADPARVAAHQDRERDGGGHGEQAPRAFRKRPHDDERQHRQDDDHNHERPEQRDRAGNIAHFHPDQFAERAAVAAHRNEQDHEILHRAGKHDAGQDPERPGQIAHLRRQHRADERARPRDRREMMAEQDVAIGGNVIEAVGAAVRGGGAGGIDAEHRGRDIAGVETVGDQIDRDRRGHDPERVDLFPARGGDDGERAGRERRQRSPARLLDDRHLASAPFCLLPTVSRFGARGKHARGRPWYGRTGGDPRPCPPSPGRRALRGADDSGE